MVLPGAFPNLLANGSQGIAVGMATSIPPHNAAELCDAALHLIDTPNARSRTLLKYVPGPDFPTGGVIVDPPEAIAEAYTTGRGSFRVRARWHKEDTGRGTYQIVVTEIPWLVQKGRLVEKLAELLNEKKLPLVADVRDESAEDIRLVIEPRSRTVDAELLMESLFKLTELESRIPLNMNVLVKGRIPKVVGLAEALSEWLAHRRDVLLRRSNFRLGKIEHRLEVLGGYLIAYLNLDKVIKIIRTEDEPKPVLMKTFKLTDVQADAILNMRLRNLRKLEEMEIRKEDKDLRAERKTLKELLGSEKEQWKTVADEIKEVRDEIRPEDAARQAPHDASPRRRSTTRPRSRRRWSSASRSPSWSRRRAGSARCAAPSPISPASPSRPTTGSSSRSRPRPRRSVWCSPPTAASTRSTPPSCRAGAATASRSACSSTSSRRPTWSPCSATRAGASSWSAARRARLRRARGRMPRQHPQGQAGAQRHAARRGACACAWSRANWSPRSARTARW